MSTFVVEADGGSRGNPGPAGYGALVRDAASGGVLAETAEAIGHATNNVAEYRGLIAGLAAAASLDPAAEVLVRMDSKLVVEQMSGRWKIKHADMVPLAARAREIAAGLGSVAYEWIPRAENAAADRLANEAMDAAARGEQWTASASAVADPAESATPAWSLAASEPLTTVLLRHGETPLSAEKRFAGLGDHPLTDRGVAQARAAAAALDGRGVQAIVSSPLSRCRATAAEAAAVTGLPVRVEEDFRETDFGAWEGLTFAEASAKDPDALKDWLASPALAPPGGESFEAVARRVRRGLDRLRERHPGETVLVVSHVTPIKLLVKEALGAPLKALYRMHLDVASLSTVAWYADGPASLRSFNDTHHLG
ncbi:bifunctional RNase H/acid phosphatase [Actinomadura parmotrematis]|uniref:Bifunctional RNase H/acid phosphatase n=1 Tax=Actinomadura parmotrematis TaxID=2864039 RepID=A0ABS7FWG5_9ACTN|nr:bifunctional RNase H/acid phosphatase [Actinomadura parmotrematis]MBW8484775.1 bifunctional RNase H/acid phosphatase [Actinomadura parmotrematis]